MLKDWIEDLDSLTFVCIMIILTLILFAINILSIDMAANITLLLLILFCIIAIVQ